MAGIGFYGVAVTYPGGAPASNEQINVYLFGTSTLAVLYDDAAGTIPLANPVTTDGIGNISFFVDEGDYELEVRGFRVRVYVSGNEGEPGPPGPSPGIEHQQTTPSASWVINVPAGLGRTPNVSVYLDSGEEVLAEVIADSSIVNISFPSPVTGKAVLS